MYKRFFEQSITYYNEQWYCYPCKTPLRNLTKAQNHSENVHSTISIKTFNFRDKCVTLKNNRYKTLVKHSVVVRDIQQDYFCMNCQCSIPSFHHIDRHLDGRDHQECMNSKLKCSTNKQKSNNANDKQGNVSTNAEDPTKCTNESNLSSEVRPTYKLENSTNRSTQMANGTIAGVPYALLQEAKTYKHFSVQNTVDRKWYCHLCRSGFHSLTDMKRHSQEAHSDVATRIPDLREKSSSSSDKIDQELLNRDKVMKDMSQEYSCVPCQCSIPSLDHFYDHLIGNKHKRMVESNEEYVNTNIVPRDPAEEQRNINNDKTDDPNVSISALDRNYSIRDLPSDFKTEERSTVSFKYSCDQCNKIIEEDIIDHEITVHKSDMMSFVKYMKNWSRAIEDFNIAMHYPLFRCSFCNEVIHGVLSLVSHFSKREHEENIKFLIDNEERECDNREDVQVYIERELLSIIFFKNNDGTVQIKEQPVMYIKNSSKKFIYVCFARPFVHQKDVIEHLCKREQLEHLKNVFLTYKHIHDILVSKERNVNGVHEMSLASKRGASLNTGSLKKRKNNETRVNTEQPDHNLIVANVSNKNDGQNEENNSGLFISLDIFTDINKSVQGSKSDFESNKRNAPNRYNNKYSGEFLDFEEIMFTCSKRKLDEMKLHLEFFVSHCNNMVCLVCNDSQLSNAQMVYEHINCENHIALFTKLHEDKERVELLKELIQPTHYQQAKCYACNKIFDGRHNNRSKRVDFKYHTLFYTHKNFLKQSRDLIESILEEFLNLCYNIQYFACVTCNMRFKQKIKFLEHLDANHRAILLNRDNSMFDFCLTCATLWYGDESRVEVVCDGEKTCTSYQGHCRQLTHQYLRQTKVMLSQLNHYRSL